MSSQSGADFIIEEDVDGTRQEVHMMQEIMQNEYVKKDNMDRNLYAFIPWERLYGKSILVTGATGLIGSALVKTLLWLNEDKHLHLHILALIRSFEKAKTIFGEHCDPNIIKFVGEGVEQLPDIEEDIDYIIHGANPTSSRYFVEHPVEMLHTVIYGTDNLLRLAKEKEVESFVFLSTMETYGTPEKGIRITEKNCGQFDSTTIRNCYPLGKQCCENLCCSYFSEYHVPVKIARLTQTFGPGVTYDDGRVFAQFARCAIEHRNIVLKTKGETERSYLYTEDAVSAILTILLKGENGQAYTAANEETYCSIYEMASMVAGKYGVKVEVREQDIASQGYMDTLYMDLDTTKLRKLGWRPQVGIEEMYDRMIWSMKKS